MANHKLIFKINLFIQALMFYKQLRLCTFLKKGTKKRICYQRALKRCLEKEKEKEHKKRKRA